MDSRLDAVLTADLSELQLCQILFCLSRVLSAYLYACVHRRETKALRDVKPNVSVYKITRRLVASVQCQHCPNDNKDATAVQCL